MRTFTSPLVLAGSLLPTVLALDSPIKFRQARQESGSSSETFSSDGNSTVKILVAGYQATTAVLEFDPYATPNTLKLLSTSDGGSGEYKAWLNKHPVSPHILLSCNDHAVANATGYLQSYYVDLNTGAIQLVDKVDSGGFQTEFGVAAAHCAFLPGTNIAAVANYYGQTASTFQFDPTTGKFGEKINNGSILEFPEYQRVDGQVAVSQETSHPHMIATHPYLPTFYLPDLGEDLLRVYTYDTNGTLTNLTQYQQPLGSGPRHLAITPSGQYLYLLHELSATLSAHQVDVNDNGKLTEIQQGIPIYPSNVTFSLNISSAEVHVSNDGRYLYATMRNLTDAQLIQPSDASDTIAVFQISQTNGTLTKVQDAMFDGARQIRSLELSPPGFSGSAGGQSYLVAGGLKTNNTAVFKRDLKTGVLELVASVDHPEISPSTYIWL